ncbi:MAG: hypothetical protein OEZ06_31760 [Myxococcales bacterium]|nr:hypothetical protein [Myxococcales bacterium]
MRTFGTLGLLTLLLFTACGDDSGPSPHVQSTEADGGLCLAGTERCRCMESDGCEEGLVCLSMLCVDPEGYVPGGRDAAASDEDMAPRDGGRDDGDAAADAGASATSDDAGVGEAAPVPSVPSGCSATLNRTTATRFHDAVRCLFEGDAPVQSGITPNTLNPERVAVVRGRVIDDRRNH